MATSAEDSVRVTFLPLMVGVPDRVTSASTPPDGVFFTIKALLTRDAAAARSSLKVIVSVVPASLALPKVGAAWSRLMVSVRSAWPVQSRPVIVHSCASLARVAALKRNGWSHTYRVSCARSAAASAVVVANTRRSLRSGAYPPRVRANGAAADGVGGTQAERGIGQAATRSYSGNIQNSNSTVGEAIESVFK